MTTKTNAGRFNELRHQLAQVCMANQSAIEFLLRGTDADWAVARTFIVTGKAREAEAVAEMHRLRQEEHGVGHPMPNPEPSEVPL